MHLSVLIFPQQVFSIKLRTILNSIEDDFDNNYYFKLNINSIELIIIIIYNQTKLIDYYLSIRILNYHK